jgi:Fe-Mn family superoxide dismutase
MSIDSSRKAHEQHTDEASTRARAQSRRGFIAGALTVGAASALARSALADPPKTAPGMPTAPAAPGGGHDHDHHHQGEHAPMPPTAADPKAPVPTASAGTTALELPALPWPQNALEPYITANTVSFHYGKHHKGYYDKVSSLVQGTPLASKPLDQIVKDSAKGGKDKVKLFNAAAQAWNHNFYWQSIKPKGGGAPSGELAKRIDKDFGSYDNFKTQFIQTAVDHFSNGWVWLVLDKNKLKIVDTHDADTPVVHGQKPLLVADVWEHAYYLDYKNLRKDYVTAYVEHLLNWDFVGTNLG